MGIKLDHTFQVLESSLTGSTARHNTIAHNLSNVNTPGFKQFLINVEEQMANQSPGFGQLPLKISSSKHMGNDANMSEFAIERDNSPALRMDGNNVNLEKQMTAMVKNDVYFNAALNQVNKKIAMRKYVISDGRG